MLNPLWLNTFKTLIDLGHFTRTAEKLHMTQPGVSQQIQKLENACGHSLIKREKKSFELTEQGRQVYEYALKHYDQNILSKVNSEIIQMWSFKPENSFKLTTGTFMDESMFEFTVG